MASIASIVYQPEDQDYERGRSGDFIRLPLQEAQLLADHGIKGDRKARKSSRRQINLLSASWLAAKREAGYLTEPGQFGEQLVIEGMAVEDLSEGTKLQLGAKAQIEITMRRNGCERLEAAQRAGRLANTSIGILARVLTGGTIHVGDSVKLLEVDTTA